MSSSDKKDRLVYVLHDIEVGGMEVALLSAIPKLCREYDFYVIVLGHVNSTLIDHLSADEKKVFIIFDFPFFLLPFKISTIVRYINDLKPDKLVCSLWRASWVGARVKSRYPGLRFYSFIHATKYFHFFDQYCTRLAIRYADVVLVDSHAVRKFVEGSFGNIRDIRIVSFLTHKSPSTNEMINKPLALGKRKIRFLFLGSIHKVKNLPQSIKLIATLQDRGYDVIFDIYGRARDGYSESLELVKKLNLSDVVQFKGQLNPVERFEIFKQYDFYLQLSLAEGMAMSVVEAMQHGLVCIVTPVGEISNYAKDQESAIFVQLKDEKTWKDSISRVENVINDRVKYDRISDNCYHNFLGRKCYADSFIKCLE